MKMVRPNDTQTNSECLTILPLCFTSLHLVECNGNSVVTKKIGTTEIPFKLKHSLTLKVIDIF